MDYPYQLTTFIDREPQIGEPVYGGENGWYAQIALKRRFRVKNIDESELIDRLDTYCSSYPAFTIDTGDLIKPARMPVQVIEIETSAELVDFHLGFITMMNNTLQSRYPERDGTNYLPHITAEYDGKMVINPDTFVHRSIHVQKVWLLKDTEDQDSQAYKAFDFKI